jgi:cell volume regulation protein A
LIPNWAKPTLVVRDERILTPAEADPVLPGDYVYLLAPPEKAQALDRFFVNMPPPAAPDPQLLGDFFVPGDVTLGALADVYGLTIAPDEMETPLADYFVARLRRPARQGDALPLGPIALIAHKVSDGQVATVGLRLADAEPLSPAPDTFVGRVRAAVQSALSSFGGNP